MQCPFPYLDTHGEIVLDSRCDAGHELLQFHKSVINHVERKKGGW